VQSSLQLFVGWWLWEEARADDFAYGWSWQEGSSWIYPDAWEEYYGHIPPEERHDMIKAYNKWVVI